MEQRLQGLDLAGIRPRQGSYMRTHDMLTIAEIP